MTFIHVPGQDYDSRQGSSEPAANPLPRREALELLVSLVAMLGVIFLLALTMGTVPLGLR